MSKNSALDCFIGTDEEASRVYIVRQLRAPEFREFDEVKIMIGFPSAKEAKAAYLQHYDRTEFFGGMKSMPVEKFRKKLYQKMAKGRQIGLPLRRSPLESIELWTKAVVAAGIPISSFSDVVAKARAGEPESRKQLDAVYAELRKANAYEIATHKDPAIQGSMGHHSAPSRTAGENVRPSSQTASKVDWPPQRDPKKRRHKRRKVVSDYPGADQVGDTPEYLVDPKRRFDVQGAQFQPGNRTSGDRNEIQQYQAQERRDDAEGNKAALMQQITDRVELRGSPIIDEPNVSGRSER